MEEITSLDLLLIIIMKEDPYYLIVILKLIRNLKLIIITTKTMELLP